MKDGPESICIPCVNHVLIDGGAEKSGTCVLYVHICPVMVLSV